MNSENTSPDTSARVLKENKVQYKEFNKKFCYPVYLVSENYHISDKTVNKRDGLTVHPNRDYKQ